LFLSEIIREACPWCGELGWMIKEDDYGSYYYYCPHYLGCVTGPKKCCSAGAKAAIFDKVE
jgi:hypothetical protein